MRSLFILIAIIAASLFILSIVKITGQFSEPQFTGLGEVKGFEPTDQSDDYKTLVLKFKQKIKKQTDHAQKDQNWFFWMSLLVTTLTAGSTLVSSIQAAKNSSTTSPVQAQKFAVMIAILTFCSTLASFGSTHFNERKTEETKNAVDLTTKRNQFYADYEKATKENKPAVIREYDRQLD